MGAGSYRERCAFDKRGSGDDGFGNETTAFAEQFTRPARLRFLTGGEGVQAARLTGTQPVLISVRYDSSTKLIAADWRVRDVRSGKIYAITAPPANTDERKQFLDILAKDVGERLAITDVPEDSPAFIFSTAANSGYLALLEDA